MSHVAASELFEYVHDAVIVREYDGVIVSWNRAAAERYGYTAAEVVGRHVGQILDRTFSPADVASALELNGVWQGEMQVKSRNGVLITSSCRQVASGPSRVTEFHGPLSARSQTDLHLVIDHLPGLVSYIDHRLRYRFVNHMYTQWFGSPEHEMVGAKVEDVLGVEAFAVVRPEMERALSGQPVHFDTYLAYVRGGGKHVSITYVPDHDESTGDVRGFIVLVEDNTARHHAEQLLRASETKYRQIVETAHEGIWIIGTDGRTTFANGRMADLLGTSVEKLLGTHSFRYVFDEDVETAAHLFSKKMRGDCEPFEFRLRRADGRVIWSRVSGVPMLDEQGNVTGLLGMFTDITAARAAQDALRENEQRLRTLLSNLPDIVSRFDREGRLLYISPAVQTATGLPPEAFLGKTNEEAGLAKSVADYLSNRLRQIVESGSPAPVDFEMPAPGATLRRYHGLGVPEFGEDGSVHSVLTIVHDVTDQQRTEEALRRSNADLEQFAYAAAHDLQEPLRVVATYTELLLRRYATAAADPGAQKAAEFILKAVRHMQALVRDLLAYSRAVHEEWHTSDPISLDEALDQALAAIDSGFPGATTHIEREPLPQTLGERGQFAQVFQNLLSNAVKYRRKDEPLEVRIRAERAGSEWIVEVSDNGIGFDPAYAERIFGLFKRLHRDAYPGTGVGLGICRRIVERNGGRIWADSTGEGLGATFCFTVPAVD